MKIAIMAITKNGSELAMKTAESICKASDTEVVLYIKDSFMYKNSNVSFNVNPLKVPIYELVKDIFEIFDALVFVMASGIAVRTIAPLIKSKTTDPAVLVMDEQGRFVISLLSGHIGGGNSLTSEIAGLIGAVPVITTATDINGVISFDVFAGSNNLVIENMDNLKYISSELVNGNKVGLFSECTLRGNIPSEVVYLKDLSSKKVDNIKAMVVLSNRTDLFTKECKVLYLRPKNLVIGLGCKRGITKERVIEAVENALATKRKSIESVKCIATIDLKADEKGLLEYCSEAEIELKIIPRDMVGKIEQQFKGSGFVKSKVGVSCVAEPCAYIAASKGSFIMEKTSFKGITIAIFEEKLEMKI
ncbi:cobalt-precorrin 5A hydrolase [Pseudobacteroides cellulosolvens]|uniref:Cobalamin synthesis G domain-containing protein n=1 Tax=Pseudobacteroides cellulosolvens ATCC 35603 = DSM 2933 TaxID=398512 RepID=A0A0L6JQE4_9FIRM|nr:cobalt-precorrin 5A hydrolase [Pseudobacteroides cellulosolvens]KNY28009.1 Cobalamin synthesis G domain-containing protein [Pseudobacteroides cellulosolvens ATCC 35603 = DSM 2933]